MRAGVCQLFAHQPCKALSPPFGISRARQFAFFTFDATYWNVELWPSRVVEKRVLEFKAGEQAPTDFVAYGKTLTVNRDILASYRSW